MQFLDARACLLHMMRTVPAQCAKSSCYTHFVQTKGEEGGGGVTINTGPGTRGPNDLALLHLAFMTECNLCQCSKLKRTAEFTEVSRIRHHPPKFRDVPNCYPANLRVNCLVFTAFWDAATLYCFTCTDSTALVAISWLDT